MELPRKEFGVKTLRYPPSGMRKKEIRFAWDEERLGAVPRCPTIFLFRGRIKVIRSPVKRKDLGASPSLGATL
jgi:hypothetical protein